MIVLLLGLFGCGNQCDEPGALCTVVGDGGTGLAADGDCADEALLYWPSDVTIGPDGQPFVLDWNNHRIFQVAPGKKCDTLDVITGGGLVGDGPFDVPASQALWNHPTGIVFQPDGTFLFAAWHNSRVVGVDPGADTLWHVAGNGKRAFSGDEGDALEAAFDLPSSVDYGADGRLYVSDQANQRVRVIDEDGVIHTVVGNGVIGFSGDGGPAIEAALQAEVSQNADPGGRIAIDAAAQKLYIADTLNSRVRVVDMVTWTIDTLVGNGNFADESSDPLQTSLFWPRDVAVGPGGAVYIADTEHHCVRKVEDGGITTVAGVCGEDGYDGDGGPADEALLNRPLGIDVSDDGALWIADSWNQRIRRVTP